MYFLRSNVKPCIISDYTMFHFSIPFFAVFLAVPQVGVADGRRGMDDAFLTGYRTGSTIPQNQTIMLWVGHCSVLCLRSR